MPEIPTRLRYWPYPTRAVTCPSSQAPLRHPQTWTTGGPSVEFPTTEWRGTMTNRLPTLYSSARPRITQTFHHHMRVHSSVRQPLAHQGIRGSSGAQIPLNLHHVAHHAAPVYPPTARGSGAQYSLHSHNIPRVNNPDVPRQSLVDCQAVQNFHQGHQGITGGHPHMTQSLGACALQSNLQAAMSPQQSPPKQDPSNVSAAAAQPPQPASASFEEAPCPNSSPVREEAEPKEIVSTTETCPVSECEKECNRAQEVERHIWERHLPPHLYCAQPDCYLIGSRSYLLKGHCADEHPGVTMPGKDVLVIYDAKLLAKQVRTKEIDIKEAVRKACILFQEKAEEVGKVGQWHWLNSDELPLESI